MTELVDEYKRLARIPEKIMKQLEHFGRLIISLDMDQDLQSILSKIKEKAAGENENKRVANFQKSLDEVRENFGKNMSNIIAKYQDEGNDTKMETLKSKDNPPVSLSLS